MCWLLVEQWVYFCMHDPAYSANYKALKKIFVISKKKKKTLVYIGRVWLEV